MSNTKRPRGIRNNNPGNIRVGDPWQGQLPEDERTDMSFCQFTDPTWGIRALARTLITYQDRYHLRTIDQIIKRWAPPNENDTRAYINAVATATGRHSGEILDMQRYEDLQPVVEAIIRHECGKGPLATLNTWYSDTIIETALQRAGVVKRSPLIAKVPVTKETVGATAAASLGAGQLVEAAPVIVDAMQRSESNITSGSIVRVIFGVLTIVVAAYIAWAQIKKYRDGVVT